MHASEFNEPEGFAMQARSKLAKHDRTTELPSHDKRNDHEDRRQQEERRDRHDQIDQSPHTGLESTNSRATCSPTLEASNRSTTRRRPARTIAPDNASESATGTSKPVYPSSTASLQPGARVLITGLPIAIASSTDRGIP